MPKICNVCGYEPEIPAKPDNEPEDCDKCHAQGSVQFTEDDDESEE